jgi:large subunit ribosomal protein L30
MADQIKIKLIRSQIGRPFSHKSVLCGLGLTKMNRIVTLNDTPEIRGMIRKVEHLVKVVE